MEILERAYAKLNLSLDVISRQESGYHNLELIFQTVSLWDDVHLSVEPGSGISVTTNMGFLPCDESNIAYKAAKAFIKRTGLGDDYCIRISLRKRIPVCAGMGGGSADGAAVLRGLNTMFGSPLSRKDLEETAATFGSDSSFCVAGGTALGTGRGEILTDLAPLPQCWFVICKPGISISTPSLFRRIDCRKIQYRPDTEGIINALEVGDLEGVSHRIYNVFENALGKWRNTIEEIKLKLLDYGAAGSAMTGTGSAVYGIFTSKSLANAAYIKFSKYYKNCYIAQPVGKISF